MRLLKKLRDDIEQFSKASELKTKTVHARVQADGRIYISKDNYVYSMFLTVEEAEVLKGWLNALA